MSTPTHRLAKKRRSRPIRAIPPPRGRSARRAGRASRNRSRETLLRRFRRSSRKLLFEVGARIEARRAGELPIQLTLPLIDDRWHRNLHDGVEMARGSTGALQAASAEAQLLPRAGARWHFERDGSRGRRHLDARPEHRFPRRKRKVHMEVETICTIQRMRLDVDVEIEVAIPAAAQTFAALAGNA